MVLCHHKYTCLAYECQSATLELTPKPLACHRKLCHTSSHKLIAWSRVRLFPLATIVTSRHTALALPDTPPCPHHRPLHLPLPHHPPLRHPHSRTPLALAPLHPPGPPLPDGSPCPQGTVVLLSPNDLPDSTI